MVIVAYVNYQQTQLNDEDSDARKDLETNLINFMSTVLISDNFDITTIHSTKENYSAFMYLFAKNILPKAVYSDMIKGTNDSCESIFTCDDEAMCLVIFENNIKKWAKEAELKSEKNRGLGNLKFVTLTKTEKLQIPQPKYTMGVSEDVTNLRSGWSVEGMLFVTVSIIFESDKH